MSRKREILSVQIHPLHRRNIQGRGEIINDGIEQRLDPFISEGCATQDRRSFIWRVAVRMACFNSFSETSCLR
jgi:hypothetical protein